MMLRSFVIVLLMISLNCQNKTKSDEEKFNNMLNDFNESGLWITINENCASSYTNKDYEEFTDMNDGTIRKRSVSEYYNNPCGKVFFPDYTNYRNIYYIKKCLQGQVYRPAQNDCQGAGAAPDWGAVRYQFCPTNDRACDMVVQDKYGTNYYVADPTLSPAAKACDLDATAGRKWKLVYFGINLPNDIRTILPEMILGNLNLIWLDYPISNTTSYTFYFDSSSGSKSYNTDPSNLKNLSNYVLCYTK